MKEYHLQGDHSRKFRNDDTSRQCPLVLVCELNVAKTVTHN